MGMQQPMGMDPSAAMMGMGGFPGMMGQPGAGAFGA